MINIIDCKSEILQRVSVITMKCLIIVIVIVSMMANAIGLPIESQLVGNQVSDPEDKPRGAVGQALVTSLGPLQLALAGNLDLLSQGLIPGYAGYTALTNAWLQFVANGFK
jgi:hypothetical protein